MTTEIHPKILLVDDDSFLLSIYSAKFAKRDFEVATASSGMDALKKIKEGFVPNILVVDVIMPEMTGIDFIKQVQKENLAPSATTVLLSNTRPEDTSGSKDIKVDDYIIKAMALPSEVVDKVVALYKGKAKA